MQKSEHVTHKKFYIAPNVKLYALDPLRKLRTLSVNAVILKCLLHYIIIYKVILRTELIRFLNIESIVCVGMSCFVSYLHAIKL